MKQKNFFKIAIILFLVIIANNSFGQTTLYSQGFETDLNGYNHIPSQTPATNPGKQYFYRAEPSDPSIYEIRSDGPYTNITDSWFFVGSNPKTISTVGILSTGPIHVTGYENFKLSIDFGAVPNDWDANDNLSVEYSWNNTDWSMLYNFKATDTNFPLNLVNNAIGENNTNNGVVLTYALQTITSNNFVGTGNSMYIRVVCDSGANYEAFGLDNIILTGTAISSDPTLNFETETSSFNETDIDVITSGIPVSLMNYMTSVTITPTVNALSTADPADYTINLTPLTFTANETLMIPLTIKDDTDFLNETIIIDYTVTSGTANLGIHQHTVTIIDNEIPPSIGFNDTNSSETETNITFTSTNIPISVNNYFGERIDINVAITGGTAEVSDYTFTSPTALSFFADETQNITVDIHDDADTDSETLILTITETSSVTGLVIQQATHTLTIVDDEASEGALFNADFSYDNDGFADHSTSAPPIAGSVKVGPFGVSPNTWFLSYNTPPSTDSTLNTFKIVSGKLETTDWGGEGIFESQDIDVTSISTLDIAAFAVTLSDAVQNGSTEFFKYYYILDDGPPVETAIVLSGDTDGTPVNYAITNLDVSSATSLVVGFSFNCNGANDGYAISSFTVTETSSLPTTITWDGSDSPDWATAANWDTGTVPTAFDNVVIPDVATAPIISSTTGAVTNNLTITEPESLNITAGGSLIVTGNSIGEVTYNIAVSNQWHLVSSPVAGETYDDNWADNNNIVSGSGSNRGISTYQNGTPNETTGPWVYMQDGETSTFSSGIGYSLKRTSSGTYSFTGTYPDGKVNPVISRNVNNWNLIGNPYPSYIDIAAFISENTSTHDNLADAFSAIYVWDPDSGTTGAYADLITGYIHPGQAFFVNAKVNGIASITEAMQSHQTAIFYKNANTSIDLFISNGSSTKKTKINYLDDKTKGLDAGFDIGMFNGVSSNTTIYTHLIENNQGIAFARQALPNEDLESLVVPIGVKAYKNTEITFSAEALNLPTGIKILLEDRELHTFTILDEATSTYKLTLAESLNGIGRFYLHTKANNTLNITDTNSEDISMYKTNNSNLRIIGLTPGTSNIKLFNMLGKELMNLDFISKRVQDISLPNLETGIYIIQIETASGKLNKKITSD
ncbi:T9SS type A sorting domain-containing protein [Polaribacter litorisediminis]|uniref:T9SS type A sorting domain-containing protein n=1 Tax=Polaribacter litorisediminis TaxID=1908341 RepID=UPI001CC0E2CA|nr:T9SS type A sorting domain-containing protein [Polaribacter litorisediminis]UAM98463.1 T9SS type A sorting domain-containing protein [Polaribacter litorisediminis]